MPQSRTVGVGSFATRQPASSRTTASAAIGYRMATRTRPRAYRFRLEVAAALLLALDGLEQRLEVADAKATRSMALDDLEEEGRPVLHRLGEDLEEVALLVAIGLDAKLLERVDRHAYVPDPIGQ